MITAEAPKVPAPIGPHLDIPNYRCGVDNDAGGLGGGSRGFVSTVDVEKCVMDQSFCVTYNRT